MELAAVPRWLVYSQAALRFLLELAALAILALWGFVVGPNLISAIALGVGAPAFAIVLWGRYVAPRAKHFLPLAGRLAVETLVFGSAVAALIWLNRPVLAALFGVIAAANSVVIHLYRHDEHVRSLGTPTSGGLLVFSAPKLPTQLPEKGERVPTIATVLSLPGQRVNLSAQEIAGIVRDSRPEPKIVHSVR